MDYRESERKNEAISTYVTQIFLGLTALGGAAAIGQTQHVVLGDYRIAAVIVAGTVAIIALIWMGWVCLTALARAWHGKPRSWLGLVAAFLSIPVTLLMGRAVFLLALSS